MDTSKRIKDLAQEVIDFAEVTYQADSKHNYDLRFACELFSEYLHHQLDEIDRQPTPVNCRPDIQQTSELLSKLSHLINPAEVDLLDNDMLQARLMNFNSKVEHLKHNAA